MAVLKVIVNGKKKIMPLHVSKQCTITLTTNNKVMFKQAVQFDHMHTHTKLYLKLRQS